MEHSAVPIDTVLCDQCGHTFKGHAETQRSETTWSRLRMNYVPPTAEAVEIKSNISSARIHMELYEKEIQRIGEIYEKLNEEREILRQHILNQESLVSSPIRTLPVEILANIFIASCPDNYTLSPSQTICRPRGLTPFSLGLVCRLWRDILLSRPECWSSITINLCHIKDFDRSVDLLALHLERSQNNPLSISLDAPIDPYEHEAFYVNQNIGFISSVMTSILRHSDRWQQLRFLGFSAQYLSLVRGDLLKHESLPLLDTLCINLCDRLILPPKQSHSQDRAPELRSMHLFALEVGRPWFHADLCLLLGTYFNLDDVRLTVSSPLDDGAHADPQVRYESYIFSLVLEVTNTNRNLRLLRTVVIGLTMPQLTHLAIIVDPTARVDWPYADFMVFLSRSGCPLKQLDCQGVYFSSSAALSNTFPMLSHLTHLRVVSNSSESTTPPLFAEDILRQLSFSTHETTEGLPAFSMPLLQHLELQTSDRNFPMEMLQELRELRDIVIGLHLNFPPSMAFFEAERRFQQREAVDIDDAIESMESLALNEWLHETMSDE